MVHFQVASGLTPEQNVPASPSLASFWTSKRQCAGFASISGAVFARSKRAPIFEIAKAPSAMKEKSGFRVMTIQGDGRCMFRALKKQAGTTELLQQSVKGMQAQGLSRNKGIFLRPNEETDEADELRLACQEALCRSGKRRKHFKEAVYSVEHQESNTDRYCARMLSPDFWGGEPELLVLSKMLHTPIYVYQIASEVDKNRKDGAFVPIQKYGEEFSRPSKQSQVPRRPVNLLYYEGNHYNLLV